MFENKEDKNLLIPLPTMTNQRNFSKNVSFNSQAIGRYTLKKICFFLNKFS